MTKQTWSDERTTELIRLFGLRWLYIDIAKKLGVPKNAVCGKLHRLGLRCNKDEKSERQSRAANKGTVTRRKNRGYSRPTIHAPPRKRVPRHIAGIRALQRKVKPHVVASVEPATRDPIASTDCVTLVERLSDQCPYIIGEQNGPLTLMCGAPMETDHQYCAYHQALCYRPVTPKDKRRFHNLSRWAA